MSWRPPRRRAAISLYFEGRKVFLWVCVVFFGISILYSLYSLWFYACCCCSLMCSFFFIFLWFSSCGHDILPYKQIWAFWSIRWLRSDLGWSLSFMHFFFTFSLFIPLSLLCAHHFHLKFLSLVLRNIWLHVNCLFTAFIIFYVVALFFFFIISSIFYFLSPIFNCYHF